MSMVEGFMTKFDQVCEELCALRERVETLEGTIASLTVQTAAGAKSVASATSAPTRATTTATPATKPVAK